MDVSAYIAISSQLNVMRNLDVVANNVANANTAGYRAQGMMFTDYVVGAGRNLKVAYSADTATYENLSQGNLETTARPLDAAIQGDGFFELSTPLGIRYTRRGSFQIRQDGTLVTAEGHIVQSEGTGNGARPIVFGEEDTDIQIRGDGSISVKVNGITEERGRLSVVRTDNPRELKKIGNALYTSDTPLAAAEIDIDYTIAQGVLELSNVNPTSELTRLIELNRSVGTTAGYLKDIHELSRRAISTITRQ